MVRQWMPYLLMAAALTAGYLGASGQHHSIINWKTGMKMSVTAIMVGIFQRGSVPEYNPYETGMRSYLLISISAAGLSVPLWMLIRRWWNNRRNRVW